MTKRSVTGGGILMGNFDPVKPKILNICLTCILYIYLVPYHLGSTNLNPIIFSGHNRVIFRVFVLQELYNEHFLRITKSPAKPIFVRQHYFFHTIYLYIYFFCDGGTNYFARWFNYIFL